MPQFNLVFKLPAAVNADNDHKYSGMSMSMSGSVKLVVASVMPLVCEVLHPSFVIIRWVPMFGRTDHGLTPNTPLGNLSVPECGSEFRRQWRVEMIGICGEDNVDFSASLQNHPRLRSKRLRVMQSIKQQSRAATIG